VGYLIARWAHYNVSMSRVDDQQLVEGARAGDAEAFAELIRRHYPVLLASCQRMLRDRESARDAAQEATLRAMLGLDQLRESTRFGPWLVGIGLNVCRGLLGGQRLRILRETVGESAGRAADQIDLAERADAAELARRVRAAIAALPAGQRRAVALFYIGGLTHAEAAAELHTGPAAIKTRLHKARQTLRHSLHDTYKEYIKMTDQPPMLPMRIAELRRAPSAQQGLERHIVFLEDDRGRRLPIWIGPAEATWMALILEGIDMPRPGVYQFAASLLAGAGTALREVRISELTDSTFYAEAILDDQTSIDARPSDALTLALVTGAPTYVSTKVLERTELTSATRQELLDEARAATDSSRVIADEAIAAHAAVHAALRDPAD
jgi:RNA polymerase sigma factor (sigma-70 family)